MKHFMASRWWLCATCAGLRRSSRRWRRRVRLRRVDRRGRLRDGRVPLGRNRGDRGPGDAHALLSGRRAYCAQGRRGADRGAAERIPAHAREPRHGRATVDAAGALALRGRGGAAICRMRSGEGEPIPDGAAPRLTPLYQHPIPRAAEPPVIDGDLSDACWNDEAYIGDPYWRMYNAPRDAKMATYVWCAYDDENLYVAFRCETPDVGKLVANITERDRLRGAMTRRDLLRPRPRPSHLLRVHREPARGCLRLEVVP